MNKSTKVLKAFQCLNLGLIIALIIKLLNTPAAIFNNRDMVYMWDLYGLWMLLDIFKRD